ncbi:MAG: S9 family peptidase [Actinomycetota bacterium]|nr:S9 family peptidase [Actinomycetota bacterium]
MKPTDIAHLITLGWPTLSPDGRTAVVAARRADLDADEYRSQLWTIAVDGSSPPRRLTHGTDDSAPSYSPDGTLLAFLRAESGGKPQLQVLPTDGGEPWALTDLPLGAGVAKWSPDSRTIAFSARVPEACRYGQDEKITPDKEPPRRITGLQYRLDNVGFLADRREHIFLVDVAATDPCPEPRQVTGGDHDDNEVTWSPDGQWLAFLSARHERREHDLVRDVFLVRPDGSEITQLTDSTLMLGAPIFTRDGATLLTVGTDPESGGSRWEARNGGLFAIAADRPGRPNRRTDEETVHIVEQRMVATEEAALVLVENRGAVDLISVPLLGGEASVVAAGRQQIGGFDTVGDTCVVVLGDDVTGAELAVLRDGKPDRLTDFTARLRAHISPLPIAEITALAPDGYEVHGFLVEPEDDDPHPVLLMIHGGPFAAYGWTVFDEAQVYAGAGYAVVYGNPRGSSGYGEAHGAYIRHDVGERSAPDLLALLDAALQRPRLDGTRVGVLGGSHGGYMTSWLVGHTDRFGAAISERAVNALDSFEGTSDIGWGFADDLYGSDPEQRTKQSPLTYADAITTPLLIIHSEQDWRCPLEQAQRLYVALRNRDAIVEMLLFPGEGHELSRSGLPSHRVARFEAILDWFGRHLG